MLTNVFSFYVHFSMPSLKQIMSPLPLPDEPPATSICHTAALAGLTPNVNMDTAESAELAPPPFDSWSNSDAAPAAEETPSKRKVMDSDAAPSAKKPTTAENLSSDVSYDCEMSCDVPTLPPTQEEGMETGENLWLLKTPSAKKSSQYWRYFKLFDSVAHPDKKSYAACIICFDLCKYSRGTISAKGGSTSGLLRHLQHCHPEEYFAITESKQANKKRSQQVLINKIFRAQDQPKDKKQVMIAAACSWIVATGQAHNVTESTTWRRMFLVADSAAHKYVNVTNKNIRSHLQMQGRYARGALDKSLKLEHVNFTCDHWTGPNDETYSTVTGHYIDKSWNLHSVCMDFKVFEGRTTGVLLSADMHKVLHTRGLLDEAEYGIVASVKPMGVTDTTGNMIVLGRELREAGHYEHCFCLDHVLHLNAKKVFNCEYFLYFLFNNNGTHNVLQQVLKSHRFNRP